MNTTGMHRLSLRARFERACGSAAAIYCCAGYVLSGSTVYAASGWAGQVVQVPSAHSAKTTFGRQCIADSDMVLKSSDVLHEADTGGESSQISGATGLLNSSFSEGLDGWTIDVLGAGDNLGTIAVDDEGRALLMENGSFLISVRQTFKLPSNARELSFEVFFDPGFDLTDNFILDAFEVQLLDDQMQSVVPTWDPLATSFFNVQEDVAQNPAGAINLAPGVTIEPINGGGLPAFRIHLDLTGVAAGTVVTLFNDLIGADSDTASGVRVDNFFLNTQPPVSIPGGPYIAECNAASITIPLDGSASFDPDGNVITFDWSTDCAGAAFNDRTIPTPTLLLPGSVTDCTVTLSVTDGVFPPVNASTTVSVRDTTPPTIACPAARTLTATTARGVPLVDITLSATAADACSAVTTTDNRPTDFYPVGDTTVTFTARDAAGLTAQCSTVVTVVPPEIPLIECPAAITLDVCPSDVVTPDEVPLGAPIVLGQGPVTVTDDRPLVFFPTGTTTVTFIAADTNGENARCSTTVTVNVLAAGSPGCPTQPPGSTLEIECPPAVQRRLCPNVSAARTSIGLLGPSVNRASGTTVVTDDAPAEFPIGVTSVTFTVADEVGRVATCITDVLVELEDPGAAPCQDLPPIGRFQERITTTTTDTGVIACGSCGAIGLLPFLMTMLGVAGIKLSAVRGWMR